MPLNVQSYGVRDNEAFYVEAVVSAYDQGVWVADIDVLSLYRIFFVREDGTTEAGISRNPEPGINVNLVVLNSLPSTCPVSLAERDNVSKFDQITSTDCWPEFLDRPNTMAVIRAKGNWVARLALATIMHSIKETGAMLADDAICRTCVEISRLKRNLQGSEVR